MSGIEGVSADVGRPAPPPVKRTAGGGRNARPAPQGQQRHCDLVARLDVRLVLLEIGIGTGAIILACGVNTQRVAKRRQVMFDRARIERVRRILLRPAFEGAAEVIVGIRCDQVFRQRVRLREERPVIDAQRESAVHLLPVIIGRQNIQCRQARQAPRMIERKSVGDAPATVVTRQREMHMAELFHDLDHHLRHGALGERRVVLVGLRHVGPAIAGQIRDHESEPVRQHRRDAMPHHMGLRITMQQQQRRPLAADTRKDASATRADPFGSKTGKQIGEIGHRALPSRHSGARMK